MKQQKMMDMISVPAALLMMALAALNVYTATAAPMTPSLILWTAVKAVVAVTALIYIFCGFQKTSARYFRIFAGLYAIMQAVREFTLAVNGNPSVEQILAVFALAAGIALALVLNLGRTKSLIAVGVALAVDTVNLILMIAENGITLPVSDAALLLVTTMVYGVMVIGKYLDKAARGRTV